MDHRNTSVPKASTINKNVCVNIITYLLEFNKIAENKKGIHQKKGILNFPLSGLSTIKKCN